MLWAAFRVLLFLALVGLAAFGVGSLLEAEGAIRIELGGWTAELSPLWAAILGMLLALALWLVLRLAGLVVALVRLLRGDRGALGRFLGRSRERRGRKALAEALVALASGDARRALSRAERARRLLSEPEPAELLVAEAAEKLGDRRRAEAAWKTLLSRPATRLAAVRGLLRAKLAEGDKELARKLAKKALSIRPDDREMQDLALRLAVEAHDWPGARRALDAKLRAGALPRDVWKRRAAVLLTAEAQERADQGEEERARSLALEALRLSPGLVPAAVLAARLLAAAGERAQAARIIRRAWKAAPHPDLAEAWAALEPEEDAPARLARFGPLLKMHPEHPEVRLLEAELRLAAGDAEGARKALGDLPQTWPVARVLALMAAIERARGASEDVVRGWLARAVVAPRGPAWVCESCGHAQAEWAAACPACGALDSFAWKEAEGGEGPAPRLAESAILPLVTASPRAEGERPEADGAGEERAEVPAEPPLVNPPSPAGEGAKEGSPTADMPSPVRQGAEASDASELSGGATAGTSVADAPDRESAEDAVLAGEVEAPRGMREG